MLRKDARARRFKVMAADILDTSNLRSYLRKFLRQAKGSPAPVGPAQLPGRQLPHVRGHARGCCATVPGEVWLTETGGLVKFDGRGSGTARARAATAHEVDVQAGGPVRLAPARLRSKITQLFVYKWFGEPRGARFDSGLVNPRRHAAQGVLDVFRKTRAEAP